MNNLGDELFKHLRNIQDSELTAALEVTRKLKNSEPVSDGDLLDALYAFVIRLDLVNPLLPVCHETLKRFMQYAGLTETPRGLQREWLDEGNMEDLQFSKEHPQLKSLSEVQSERDAEIEDGLDAVEH